MVELRKTEAPVISKFKITLKRKYIVTVASCIPELKLIQINEKKFIKLSWAEEPNDINQLHSLLSYSNSKEFKYVYENSADFTLQKIEMGHCCVIREAKNETLTIPFTWPATQRKC